MKKIAFKLKYNIAFEKKKKTTFLNEHNFIQFLILFDEYLLKKLYIGIYLWNLHDNF